MLEFAVALAAQRESLGPERRCDFLGVKTTTYSAQEIGLQKLGREKFKWMPDVGVSGVQHWLFQNRFENRFCCFGSHTAQAGPV